MTTKVKENYLKALYHLHLKSSDISLSDLGASLGLSKPTVNEMAKKLHGEKLLIYEKYKPLKLTNKGKKEAALIVRKHRLAEMFLSQIMNFGWEEVHDIAEEIEHLGSEKLFDRMDELLGFPNIDPHGSPIPDKNGNIHKHNYLVLSDCDIGSKVILKTLKNSSTEFLLFLNKKNLKLGAIIQIIDLETFDRTITISYGKQKNIIISESVSKRLLVEVI